MQHILLSQDFFPIVGGAHLWLYEVYKRWPETVTAVVPDYSDNEALISRQNDFDSRLHGNLFIQRHSIQFDGLSILDLSYLSKCRQLNSIIKKLQPDQQRVLHCLRAFPEGVSGAIHKWNKLGRSKLITYAHGEEILIAQSSRQLSFMARFAYASSDLVIANSESTRKLVQEISPRARIEVVNPGVDASFFQVSDQEKRKQKQNWGFSDSELVLVSISRMEPRKNHARVLQAVADLRNDGLPLACVFASEGEEKQNLQKLAQVLEIQNKVHFPGYLTDCERALSFAAADIHILPSIQHRSSIEGYGIVFLEAAAAGIPSIAGNVGGQSEAVKHGETGYVVDGTDLEQIKSAIFEMVQNPGLRKQMGEAGKQWAKQNDWDLVSESTCNLITSTLA